MKLLAAGIFAILVFLMAGATVTASQATIPLSGTVFIGEQGLDIMATGARSGDRLVWYGPGGSTTSTPSAMITVSDPSDFYISPVMFSGKTGPWFLDNGSSVAFFVQEPQIAIRVFDLSAGFEVTKDTVWVPRGDSVGFQIDTNVAVLASRPGSSGAPVTIRIRGPSGVLYSAVSGYPLEDVLISSSPFSTGPVWFTGNYESGNYTIWAESTGNDMNDNYPAEGKTFSPKVTFLLQSVNPLITPEKTPVVTTVPTLPPTTLVTTVSTPVVETSPQTPAPTGPATPVPSTPTSGFSGAVAVLSLAAMLVPALLRR